MNTSVNTSLLVQGQAPPALPVLGDETQAECWKRQWQKQT
jgi:hypothetical protein